MCLESVTLSRFLRAFGPSPQVLRRNPRLASIDSTTRPLQQVDLSGGLEPVRVEALPLSRDGACSGPLRLGVGLGRMRFRLPFLGLHLKSQSD